MYLMLFFGPWSSINVKKKKRNMWVNVVWIGWFVLALCKFKFLKTSKWEVEVERITKSKFGVGTFECLFHILFTLVYAW
jgi:hypothetical protein